MMYAHAYGWTWSMTAVVALLAIVPMSELTIQALQRVLSRFIPPRRLARLDLSRIPESARTMVIVPTILDSVERAGELVAHLEVQALGNLDPHIHFAILSDFTDADVEMCRSTRTFSRLLPTASKPSTPSTATAVGSFLPVPPHSSMERTGTPLDGWERKRGKIEEFNRLLRGATDTSFVLSVGDAAILPAVHYCITLDSDTRLPRDAARQLIGIITHPLNRPGFDQSVGRVTQGYGILQPRVSVTFASAGGSLFARLYSGHTGVDPYDRSVRPCRTCSGEGVFTGKGLCDVDASWRRSKTLRRTRCYRTICSKVCTHASHSCRTSSLSTNIRRSVLSRMRDRQHRWIRGRLADPALVVPVCPDAPMGIKAELVSADFPMEDPRQLAPQSGGPMLLALLVAGWTVLPGAHWFWTTTVVAVMASQLLPLFAQ
jgi:cyclic beta-1,2-glucan synthetase